MRIKLPYGKGDLLVDLPDNLDIEVLETESVKPTAPGGELVKEAIRDPIDSPPLKVLARNLNKTDRVVMVITDQTRPCPDNLIVPVLIEELTEAGVKPKQIAVVVATGLHGKPTEEQARKLAGGSRIPSKVTVGGHDAQNSKTVKVGRAPQGYRIEINQAVAEADFIITTGFIEPHFFAGFSGGRKSILPGVASQETIMANHSYQNIAHSRAEAGLLQDNPVHEGAVKAAKLVGVNFIVNVLLNKRHQIVGAVAGDLEKAFLQGVHQAVEICGLKSKKAYHLVITTNSGYPLDQDLYQTVKGMYTASQIARRKAPLIIASSCSQGIGPDSFYKLNRDQGSPEGVLAYIKAHQPIVAQWENQVLCEILTNHPIYLISELPARKVEDMMLRPMESVEEALSVVLDKVGGNPSILVLPEGPFTLPYVDGSLVAGEIKKLREE